MAITNWGLLGNDMISPMTQLFKFIDLIKKMAVSQNPMHFIWCKLNEKNDVAQKSEWVSKFYARGNISMFLPKHW